METKTIKVIRVAKYRSVDNFESHDVPRPGSPTGIDILIQVKACSMNPIDTKVRKGTYDNAPGNNPAPFIFRRLSRLLNKDYYKFIPKDFYIIGFDGAGTVLEVGPKCTNLKPSDDYVLVNKRLCAKKPKSLDFVEAVSIGLTFGTAYQSLIDRLEIKQNENVSILIINSGGGVRSATIQIARKVLQLPVVIITASRSETMESYRKMGATHIVNHREDLES
ncbi:hypothetical protein N7490_002139 [Penicillium lividum]|nr:hypothetical protein N7490_002139 [Penicillium lividum]